MSFDDQLDIFQEKVINYIINNKLLLYLMIIIINKFLIIPIFIKLNIIL